MSTDGVDTSRRRFLTAATSVVGAVGAVYVAVPFLASMAPSERARAAGAPVEVDISKLEPGQKINVEWRGKPVWVVKRTPEMLEALRDWMVLVLIPRRLRRSSPTTPRTPTVPSSLKFWCWSVSAPIWVARLRIGRKWRRKTWVPIGRAVSSAPVTVRNSIWPAAYTKRCPGPHQPDRSAAPLCR